MPRICTTMHYALCIPSILSHRELLYPGRTMAPSRVTNISMRMVIKITNATYSGHSPRCGAVQHAADNGIIEYDIQRLGRWFSETFKGYFYISQAYKSPLNRRFQTGHSVPVIQTSLNVPTG